MKKSSKSDTRTVGGAHHHAAHPPLPLMDEVHGLLEKEKLLYQLKSIESKQQADEWKSRYEQLIGQMADSAAITGNYHTYEIAAELESGQSGEQGLVTDVDASIAQAGCNALNLSHKSMQKTDVINLTKSLKEMKITVPVALLLSRNGFSDVNCSSNEKAHNADTLGSLIAVPHVDAIDLSYNDLGEGFENTLIDSLRLKKRSPQYVLLHGNTRMSLCPNIADLLALLSDRSWGVSVTLEDMLEVNAQLLPGTYHSLTRTCHNFTQVKDPVKVGKSRPGDASDFSGGSHKSMKCADFLKILNATLEQKVSGSAAVETAETKAALALPAHRGKHAKAAPAPPLTSKRIRAVERRQGSLQLMSVLGLTDACLSKTSIDLLRVTLALGAASLTDLDLSFSFTGYSGAVLIRDALKSPDCQLIRLGLAGNTFADKGVETMLPGLLVNKTLTYLDLRSNFITGKGLQSLLTPYKTQAGPPPLTKTDAAPVHTGYCQAMKTIDLSQNPISLTERVDAERVVRSVGRDTNFKFISQKLLLLPTTENSEGGSLSQRPRQVVLFTNPQYVSCELLPGMAFERRVYSVDTRHLLTHVSNLSVCSLLLTWYARVGGGDLAKPKVANTLAKKAKKNDENDDGVNTGQTCSSGSARALSTPGIRWEVRYATPKGEVFQATAKLCETTGFASSEWVCCSTALATEPPSRGAVELWAIMSGRPPTLLECHSFQVISTPPTLPPGGTIDPSDSEDGVPLSEQTAFPHGYRLIGGDVSGWSAAMNSLASKRCLEELNSPHGFSGLNHAAVGDVLRLLPQGHIPLRALRWTVPGCSAKLSFSIKLFPVEGVGAAAGVGSASTDDSSVSFDPYSRSTVPIDQKAAKTVGYVWRVSVYGADGDYKCLEREGGSLSQNKLDEMRVVPEDTRGSKRPNPIVPWMWRHFTLELGSLSANDTVVISGSVLGDSSPSSAASRCTVQIRDCKLFANAQELSIVGQNSSICRGGIFIPVEGHALSTAVSFAVHNDSRVLF